jgi:8-amino-7-oxononanoate synthase
VNGVRAGSGSGSVGGGAWDRRIRAKLDQVIDEGRWRAPREFDARGPAGVLDSGVLEGGVLEGGVLQTGPGNRGNGSRVVSFASNDYLGLSMHPAVVAAAVEALGKWGAGSGASRLVTGSRPVHTELERALADWKGCEAAICFPTGFAANLGVLSVLGGSDVRVLSDSLNHASIIDGCRLSKATVSIFRHGDTAHLAELLGAEGHAATPTVVVTDTVFSMDGDAAPLDEIAALCRRHGALLLLDEAHAVLGPTFESSGGSEGGGGGENGGVDHGGGLTVVRVGTLSKTLGSMGGFVAGPRNVIDLLVNLARPYIFTTALTPADSAAALAALGVLRSPEGDALVARLRALVTAVAGPEHPSPIIPVVLGSEERALDASAALLRAGLWVPAIRPPTVPVGTSRLRVTISAAHTDAQVSQLIDGLRSLRESAAGSGSSGSGSSGSASSPGASDSAALAASR